MVHLKKKKKAENALNINQCCKESNCIENYAAKLLMWINVCNQLTVLNIYCVSCLCCKLETIDIYIYALFYYKEVYCIGNAMRHEFASCFSLPCSLKADVYNGNALK